MGVLDKEDIVYLILQRLEDPRDIVLISTVCKAWHKTVNLPIFWESLLEHYGATREFQDTSWKDHVRRAFGIRNLTSAASNTYRLPVRGQGLCYSRAPRKLAITGSYGQVNLVKPLKEYSILHQPNAPVGKRPVVELQGCQVAVGERDGSIEVWSAGSYTTAFILTGHQGPVNYLSSSGADLLVSSTEREVRVWSLTNKSCVAMWESPRHQEGPTHPPMAFILDQVLLVPHLGLVVTSAHSTAPAAATSTCRTLLSFHSVPSGECLCQYSTTSRVTALQEVEGNLLVALRGAFPKRQFQAPPSPPSSTGPSSSRVHYRLRRTRSAGTHTAPIKDPAAASPSTSPSLSPRTLPENAHCAKRRLVIALGGQGQGHTLQLCGAPCNRQSPHEEPRKSVEVAVARQGSCPLGVQTGSPGPSTPFSLKPRPTDSLTPALTSSIPGQSHAYSPIPPSSPTSSESPPSPSSALPTLPPEEHWTSISVGEVLDSSRIPPQETAALLVMDLGAIFRPPGMQNILATNTLPPGECILTEGMLTLVGGTGVALGGAAAGAWHQHSALVHIEGTTQRVRCAAGEGFGSREEIVQMLTTAGLLLCVTHQTTPGAPGRPPGPLASSIWAVNWKDIRQAVREKGKCIPGGVSSCPGPPSIGASPPCSSLEHATSSPLLQPLLVVKVSCWEVLHEEDLEISQVVATPEGLVYASCQDRVVYRPLV